MKSLYRIEFYMPAPIDKWHTLPSFNCLQKSFAMGAWAMLRAHYGHNYKHRLLKDGQVVEECGFQKIQLNNENTNH